MVPNASEPCPPVHPLSHTSLWTLTTTTFSCSSPVEDETGDVGHVERVQHRVLVVHNQCRQRAEYEIEVHI